MIPSPFLPPAQVLPGTRSDAAAPSTHKQAATISPSWCSSAAKRKQERFQRLSASHAASAPRGGHHPRRHPRATLTDPSQRSARAIRCTLCDLAGSTSGSPGAQANPYQPQPQPILRPQPRNRPPRRGALRARLRRCAHLVRSTGRSAMPNLLMAHRRRSPGRIRPPARTLPPRPRAIPTPSSASHQADLPPNALPPEKHKSRQTPSSQPARPFPSPSPPSTAKHRPLARHRRRARPRNLPGSGTVAVVARHARALARPWEIDAALNLLPPDLRFPDPRPLPCPNSSPAASARPSTASPNYRRHP